MATASTPAGGAGRTLSASSGGISDYLMRLLGLAVIDAFAVWLMVRLFADGNWQLGIVFVIITILINAIFLVEELYPLRWMAPGLALLILMVLYPVLFTVYIAFTNYSDGHLLPKDQAIQVLGQRQFVAEGSGSYSWTAYRSQANPNEFALALVPPDGGEVLIARPGQPLTPLSETQGVGTLNEDGVPETLEGFAPIPSNERFRLLSDLQGIEFGVEPSVVKVASLREAAASQQRFVYDPAADTITDQQESIVYQADNSQGNFVSADGQTLNPGYRVEVGLRNFERVFGNQALRGPFLRVLVWTFAFAFFSVLSTFAVGLAMALLFNDPSFPGRKLLRSVLLIPYTIPAVISILIWRGLLNPQFGIVNDILRGTFGFAPDWFSDPMTAKFGILMINLWLGYPYMMLIATGALQAVPSDVYEASAMDGANGWEQFWRITLPLVLISLGPLLISSFAFNLNNFNIIYLYAEGGPPIAGAQTPAGHTDILISYTYRLAFAGGRGADYGFASAITIIIFLIVASITFFQFRYTKALEEVSENV